MDARLAAARKKFRGQKGVVQQASFDNSPLALGVHTFEVMESGIDPKKEKACHHMRIKCVEGDDKGKGMWPFPCSLEDMEGILGSANNVRAILGDVVPGEVNSKQEFEIAADAYLDEFEALSAQCIGEIIEANVVNQKAKADGSHINAKTGEPYQNVYIQRGLGEDAKGNSTAARSTDDTLPPDSSMAVGGGGTRKKTVKKKAAKKKTTKKKAKRKAPKKR